MPGAAERRRPATGPVLANRAGEVTRGKVAIDRDCPAVRFEKVSRRFGDVRAVDDVSLSVGAGEFFSMLGPSGSGKTTCLRLIAGFEQPDARPYRDLRRDGGGRAALPARGQHRLPGLCAVPAYDGRSTMSPTG